MKTKLYKYLIISLVTVFGIMGLTGCGDDITEQYFVGTQMHTISFDVTKNQWKWNENIGRYECFINLPELTQKIYNDGSMDSYVFVEPRTTAEVQNPLPFVHTYMAEYDDGTVRPYTETISSDFLVGEIGLYIQSSDLAEDDYVLPEKYEFKVVLAWDDNK
ncbi:MAG: hypothetical protein ACK5KL_21135 [Dysgonomonas sp.]